MNKKRYIQSLKAISYSLLVLSTMLFATACSQHDGIIEFPSAPAEKNVTLELTIPGIKTPSSYGLSSEQQENKVNELTVLAYKKDNGIEKLDQKITAIPNDITSDATGNVKIKVAIPAGNYNRLALIANADQKANTLVLNSELTALNTLEYTHDTGVWNDYIPMSGELVAENTNGIVVKQGIFNIFSNIKLIRMLARIDVRNTDKEFILKEVNFYNMKRNGLIVKNDNYIATPAKPNLPSTLQDATSPITHTDVPLEGNMYAFEAEAPTLENLESSPRIIIKGTYQEKDYYYPVDFTYDENEGEAIKGNFMPIIRNYQYIFTICKVTGKGYDTPEQALACTEVFTNIVAKLLAVDDDFTDIYYNSQNFLAVNITNKNIIMGRDKYLENKGENAITILTDAATFTIECYNKKGLPVTNVNRMKPNEESYIGGVKTAAFLIASQVTTSKNEFEGYIIVKAGNNLQSEKIPVYKLWCGTAGLPLTLNNYKTHRYPTGDSDAMQCWMVENSTNYEDDLEVSSKGYGFDRNLVDCGTGSGAFHGQLNGYYYTWEHRDTACSDGWVVPTEAQWKNLATIINANLDAADAIWWTGSHGAANSAFAGSYNNGTWRNWHNCGYWWSSSNTYYQQGDTDMLQGQSNSVDGCWFSVRCIEEPES